MLSIKYCILCLRHGMWICDSCSRFFIPQLPYCYRCSKISKGYTTHNQCKKSGYYNGQVVNVSPNSVFPLYFYNRQTRKYLKEMKFKSSWRLLDEIVKRSSERIFEYIMLQKMALETSIILPVPLHNSRFRIRGFNQSERLSFYVSRVTGINSYKDILKKIVNTKPQTTVKRDLRRKNVEGAFECNLIEDIEKVVTDIIIVDDVITTGSTIEECTKEIHKVYPNIRVHALLLFAPKRKRRIDILIPNRNRNEI